jgi:hypothetical protein
MIRTSIAAATVALASAASAEVIVFTQYDVWAAFCASSPSTSVIATEDFGGYSGFYEGPVVGNVGGIEWSATAEGGLFADAGYFSTNLAQTELVFALAPGVSAVGGNFFGTDINFNVVPSIVEVTLSDGTTYIAALDTQDAFVGFYSLGAEISSISTLALGAAGGPATFATANNLYVAVPAPGAIALLGLAGGVAARRRRR